MYAMQYRIILPTDYDMGKVRERVSKTGHLMDDFPGLEFKAYLIQEQSLGAPHNAYAPFYVWKSIDGMRRFCWGEPGYSAIVRDFGRHPIHTWTVHEKVNGPARYGEARSLKLRTVSLPAHAAPSDCLRPLTEDFLSHHSDSTVLRMTAVDVTNWNVLLVELSSDAAVQSSTDALDFEVLHTSTSK